MCVCLISPVPIAEPLTSELIDTPVFHNLAPRPIKYRVSVPIPTPPPASFCVISEGQRNYGWRGGGSCDIAAAATLNVSLDEKGLWCVSVCVCVCVCVCVALLDKLQTFFFF